LTGGIYDAGGDPAVAFDSHGHVFYAGLGFNRTTPPNTVTVSKGTFNNSGLTWSAPTFINATTAPSTINDKEWIAVDSHPGSAFRDRVYVSWTRFVFNAHTGAYVQSPIAFAYSKDGGATFSAPQLIVGNVLYSQGSHPTVGPDGTVYVFWDGATRRATLDSIWMVKSADGGVTWSKPVAVSPVVDIIPIADTAFRNNSYPSAAVAPDGTLYAIWSSLMSDATGALCPTRTNSGCHAAVIYSKSTDGGGTWSKPVPAFPTLDAATRTPIGYPVNQPDGTQLTAPAPRRVDTLFPAVSISPSAIRPDAAQPGGHRDRLRLLLSPRMSWGDVAIGPNGEVMEVCILTESGQGGGRIYVNVDPDGLGPAGFGDHGNNPDGALHELDIYSASVPVRWR
jgi:hypothetical protein